MRVLIMLTHNPKDSFLVKLHTDELIRQIKKFLKARDNSSAIITALTKGQIEASGNTVDARSVDAQLSLTRDRISWDLMK